MPARLKSLELHGYKTFASRTEFQFADTVTAIVGPNGSGKSNIADAIRWVLGEQSYSLLRAKKTEDMIFAGSELRTRAGMASAMITFDNGDGWLPIDFTEVAITRRAYRDGQNEYLINGQRVRLKDVSELLAQSGLAERTYTIIGQGLVDAALALKAEDRRRLFEEAAGIGLHRSRREEALKRLEATKHNLERVQDILAELAPRLRSLERQARRMMEYEQVKADLQVLLRDWYGYHWHSAQRDLQTAKETARVQEAALDKARLGQDELDRQAGDMRSRIQGLRDELGMWHRQLSELHSQREGLGKSIAIAEERIRSLGEQELAAEQEKVRLEEEIRFYQERLETARGQVEQMKAELEDARQQADQARKALQARQSERTQAEQALQTARQAQGTLTARQSFLQARLEERKGQGERQHQEVQKARGAVGSLSQETKQAEARLEAAHTALARVEQARRTVEKSLADHHVQLTEKENERKNALEKRSAIQAQVARLSAQIEVLAQAERGLAGYASGARALLQSIRQNQLKGARGALSSELDVPAELETAIAAALGEFLDAIVLREESLEPALQILQSQAARGALLPLEWVQDTGRLSLENLGLEMEGVLGIAAGLVKAKPEMAPVVDLLLGRTILVRDHPVARRVMARLPANTPGLRVVTLNGEVFLAEGPVLAGQEGKPGTLSRPREKRELQEKLAGLEAQSAGLDRVVQESQAALQALALQEEKLRREVQTALEMEKKAAAEAAQVDVAADKTRRALQWQREQLARQQQEIDRAQTETVKMTEELKRLDAETAQAREITRQHSGALAALALDELQTQVSHWSTRAAVADRASTDAQNQYTDRKGALERTEQTVLTLQNRVAEFRASLAALAQQQEGSAHTEQELHGRIETLTETIRPAEARLDGLEQEMKTFQKQDGDSRQALSMAEHYNAQAKIGLARRQEALEGLRGRIEDDFGLVEFKYAEEVSGPTPLPLIGLVEQLPEVREVSPELEEMIKRQRAQLRRMGPINPEAQSEYIQVKERHSFLVEQVADLHQAEQDIKEVIVELDVLMEREFRRTFEAVAQEFRQIFTRLFGGGTARLVLTSPEDMTDTGIDIEARLPGRREQGLSLLSGGERSLTAAALVFALLKVSPTPFCVFDEVDAMLDEANVSRFRDLLRELSANTQFVVVTHNRNTVQAADVIYGVTMGSDSASQVISLKLDEVSRIVPDKN